MPIPRDPDTLRVPAFMRKRSLRSRARRPLLLTALDRKKAGVVLPELMKPKKKPAEKRAKNDAFADAEFMRTKPISSKVYSWPMLPFEEPAAPRAVRTRRRKEIASCLCQGYGRPAPAKPKRTSLRSVRARNDTSFDYFAEPLIDAPKKASPRKARLGLIGQITHYYGKIQVGVIKLKATLSVGDCIRYETPEGTYEQIVESMEIDRSPVFTARKGDNIGLKLRQIARVGSAVVKIKRT